MSDIADSINRHRTKAKTQPTSTPRPDEDTDETWEDRNKRRSFHLPITLLDRLSAAAKEDGVSMSAMVRESIEQLLDGR